MRKKQLILFLFFVSILLNGQSRYSYQVVDSFDDYLKNTPLFWSHIISEFSSLQSDSLSKEIIKEKKLSLLEDLGRWGRNYEHLTYQITQEQKNEYDSIVTYYLSSINYTQRQLMRYLEDGANDSDFMQLYIQISKYKPSPKADKFLNNFETFVKKDIKLSLPYEIEEYYFYELKVLQSDLEKYQHELNSKQKRRLERLIELFESKRIEWEKRKREQNKNSYIEGGLDIEM